MITAREILGGAALAYRFVGQEHTHIPGVGWSWEDAPLPLAGESLRYADLRPLAGTPADTDYYIIPLTSWGDYVGSVFERSNARVLLTDCADSVLEVTGDFDSHSVAVSVGAAWDEDGADWQLVQYLRALTDPDAYPILDEEGASALEHEIAAECWESYGAHDMRDEIGSELIAMGYESDAIDAILADVTDDALCAHYWEAVHASGDWPYCEDAVSAVLWRREGHTVASVAALVLAGLAG